MAKITVKKDTYRDSLILMKIANAIREMENIRSCTVALASEQNKTTLPEAFWNAPAVLEAGPNDLLIVIDSEDEEATGQASRKIEEMLAMGRLSSGESAGGACRTSEQGWRKKPDATLALISIPGPYVREEAQKNLDHGLNLHIFSDNVPREDELALKKLAREKGLLVMGPDCGTANIAGYALAFANKVRTGPIGIVGAAGTGIQEVSTLVHRWGSGVSHAIGTGSNDISDAIGGLTTIDGLRKLVRDAQTEVIVIVSKPPAPRVEAEILKEAQKSPKPVVVAFLGGDLAAAASHGGIPARTLEDAARLAVQAAHEAASRPKNAENLIELARQEGARLLSGQKYVRGLYSGGTLANEACLIVSDTLSPVYINTSLRTATRLEDTSRSIAHTFIDLADDEFTQGKPHTMAEPAMRFERILQEAADPETAVILMDIVIGYGVHQDPAGAVAKTLARAKAKAAEEGRYLPIVASICGVDEDPQNREEQAEKLKQAGVVVLSTNARAARLAAMIAGRTKADESRDLLHDRLEVINIGLPEFANDLGKQGAPVVHVDWRPPRAAARVEVKDPVMRGILGKLL